MYVCMYVCTHVKITLKFHSNASFDEFMTGGGGGGGGGLLDISDFHNNNVNLNHVYINHFSELSPINGIFRDKINIPRGDIYIKYE